MERREKLYNMGKGNLQVDAAADQLEQSESEDEDGNVVIKKRINRQIEEGVYGVEDSFSVAQHGPHYRKSSIVEMHNDLDAMNEDEFDKIIDQEKAIRKSKSIVDRNVAVKRAPSHK